MAFTGKGCNLIGSLTNWTVQWYNKNIRDPLVKTGNPVAQFVAGFGNGSIEMVGAMGQFSVYDTGKAVHTLLTNPEAQAQFEAGIGDWWKQVRSGDAYTLGQTTATVLSVIVDPDDVGVAVSKASRAESLLGKMGTFTESVVVSSAKNAKNLITLPGRTIDNIGSKIADLSTVLSEGKGVRYAFADVGDGHSVFSEISQKNIEYVDADKICEDRYKQWINSKISEGMAEKAKNYIPVEFKGTVKVGGEVKDVSRRVYQSKEINWELKGDDGLTNLECAKLGGSPIDVDGNPFELYHLVEIESGSMVELPYIKHQEEYYDILHGLLENSKYPKLTKLKDLSYLKNKSLEEIKEVRKIRSDSKRVSFRSNEVLNKKYNNFRSAYWKWRAKQIESSLGK